MSEIITDTLDLWSTALITKSTAGRGSNRKLEAYGIKKLRELILELAVRGKLVPQVHNDEPASVLLENIAKEKARLIQEGLIKKEKSLPEIRDDEKSFALPNGWEWSRLQDVLSYVQRGKGPQYADFGKVQVVSQKCIQWAGFDLSQTRYVDDTSLDRYQVERFLRKDDLLWNSTGTGTAGRINVMPEVESNSLVADSHVTIIRPLMVSSNFLSCYVAAPGIQQRIEPEHENSLVSGTTNQVELNLNAVVRLVVPIPPLEEQHRIVAKVDELMALCDQLEQQHTLSIEAHQTLVETLLNTLTCVESQQEFSAAWARIANHFDTLFTTEASVAQLKQTIIQLAAMGKLVPQDPNDDPASVLLGKIVEERRKLTKEGKLKSPKVLPEIAEDDKPFNIPSSWKWLPWGEMLALEDAPFKRGPFGSALKKDMFVSSGYKVYEQYCPINDDCSFERYYITAEKYESMKMFAVKANDYLVSCSGVTLGRITQVPEEFKEGIINQALLRVRINHKYVDKDFFKLLFRSPYFQKNIFDNSTGSAIPNVKSVTELKSMPVPLLPLAEQHRIVAKVDELMALCDSLKAQLADAQAIQLHLADAIVEQAVC